MWGTLYHQWRSNGSVSFEMLSGGHDVHSFIPRWNEEAATLESREQRVKLSVSSTKTLFPTCPRQLHGRQTENS